jgi:phosphoribosyl 1,2-cyclic phosphate phosphodiesterase
MKLTFLGSGTSHGVPVIGCQCATCRSKDERDFRLRASLYIEGDRARAVIDTGPEFRLQALRAGITRLDAVFLTHAHADHIHGLDDVRPLSRNAPLPVYGNQLTMTEMTERFSYVFRETQRGGGKPRLLPRIAGEPIHIGSLVFTPIPIKHGRLDILGWGIRETKDNREGPEAIYLTDISAIPPASLALLQSPEVLIIGAIREAPHETHFSFEQALTAAVELNARRVWLTHISHEHTHQEIEAYCRNFLEKRGGTALSMGPAYDGLELNL